MGFQIFLQLTITGLAWGSVYACIALGFVLIYKSTDIFNFAQPELMMLGAYMAFALITFFKLPLVMGLFHVLIGGDGHADVGLEPLALPGEEPGLLVNGDENVAVVIGLVLLDLLHDAVEEFIGLFTE